MDLVNWLEKQLYIRSRLYWDTTEFKGDLVKGIKLILKRYIWDFEVYYNQSNSDDKKREEPKYGRQP